MSDIQKVIRLADVPIALIGMAGSGKTTVGRKLAKVLGLSFYDSDELVEKATGLSLVALHQEKGEEYFRKIEEEVLSSLLAGGACVISTGGNTLNNQKLAQLIRANAVAVWLRADFETLYKRVIRRNTRPELNVGDRRAALEKLFTRNSDGYLKASNIVVEAQDFSADLIVAEVASKLEEFLELQGVL